MAALNDPAAVTWKLTGAELLELLTVTLAGAGVVKLKSTTCSARAKSCVTVFASVPTPWTLNRYSATGPLVFTVNGVPEMVGVQADGVTEQVGSCGAGKLPQLKLTKLA